MLGSFKCISICFLLSLTPFLVLVSAADEPSTLDLSHRYLLLATQGTGTLQDELNQAGPAGFKVVSAKSGVEMLVLLEAAPVYPREFKLLAALGLNNLENELAEASAQGFRFVPNGTLRNSRLRNEQGEEVVVLLDRTPGSTKRFEYVLATASADYEFVLDDGDVLDGALQEEPLQTSLHRMVQEGYDVVGFVSRSTVVRRSAGSFLGSIAGATVKVRRVQYIVVLERSLERHSLPLAEKNRPALRERYRLIANNAGPELQQELSQVAAEGYRLLQTAPDAFPEMVLVMEKASNPADTFEYLVLSGSVPESLQNQMKAASDRGFRLHQRATFYEPLMVIMERGPGVNLEYDYSLLETSRTATLQKELTETAAQGYCLAGVGTGEHHQLVIMEKSVASVGVSESSATPAADRARETRHLGGHKPSKLEKDLNEAAAQGYRVTSASAFGAELSFTMEKSIKSSASYEYQILGTTRVSTLEKELNQAATQGFRLVPSAMLAKATMFKGEEILAVIEKEPGSTTSCQYLILSTMRESTLEKEIEQTCEQGYELLGRIYRGGDHVAFMERLDPK